MKTRKQISLILFSIFFISVAIFSGCKKDDNSSTNPTTTTSDDMTTNASRFQESEGVGSDVDVMADQAVVMHDISMRPTSTSDDYGIMSCATVLTDTVTHVTTIDFGSGCTANGHTRRGKIIITCNGSDFFTAGYQRTITFDNYYIDNLHIEGTRIITYDGLNTAGHPLWTIDAENMKISRPNGSYHTWNSHREREMVAGSSTILDPLDDVFSVTGSASGVNSLGDSCTAIITNALIKQSSCHYRFVSGTVEVTPAHRAAMTLDFGSGTCDDLATISRNGVTITIHIH